MSFTWAAIDSAMAFASVGWWRTWWQFLAVVMWLSFVMQLGNPDEN